MIENKKIIMFGASEKNYAEQIMKKYDGQIIYCIDNDTKKHNTKYKDKYTIYPVEKILGEEKGTYIVVTTAVYYFNKMAAQLISMGLEKNIDFVFAGDILDTDSLKKCWEKNRVSTNINKEPELRILHLEYSGACNLKCTYCPIHGEYASYTYNKGLLDFDTLKIIVDKCKKNKSIESLNLCGHGEIFLNPNWYEFTDYILNEMSIKEVIIYTNGMLLTVENAQKLSLLKKHGVKLDLTISIDGSTPEENNVFRKNSDYITIKNNIYNALEYINKEDVSIANAFLSDEETLKMFDYDVSFYTSVPEFILKDFPTTKASSRPIFNRTPDKKITLSGKERNSSIVKCQYVSSLCDFLFHSLAIDCKGKILKCSCTNTSTPFIGDVFNDDPVDVFYNNVEMTKARNMAREKKVPDFCRFCTDNPSKQYFILTKKD